MSNLRGILTWVILVLLITQCSLAGSQPSTPTGSATDHEQTLPDDVQRLGSVRLASAEEARGAISEAEAVQIAHAAGYSYPNETSYLVVLTDDSTLRRPSPLVGVLTWLVRWSDLELAFGGPPDAPSRPPYRYLYVQVNARHGFFDNATYME